MRHYRIVGRISFSPALFYTCTICLYASHPLSFAYTTVHTAALFSLSHLSSLSSLPLCPSTHSHTLLHFTCTAFTWEGPFFLLGGHSHTSSLSLTASIGPPLPLPLCTASLSLGLPFPFSLGRWVSLWCSAYVLLHTCTLCHSLGIPHTCLHSLSLTDTLPRRLSLTPRCMLHTFTLPPPLSIYLILLLHAHHLSHYHLVDKSLSRATLGHLSPLLDVSLHRSFVGQWPLCTLLPLLSTAPLHHTLIPLFISLHTMDCTRLALAHITAHGGGASHSPLSRLASASPFCCHFLPASLTQISHLSLSGGGLSSSLCSLSTLVVCTFHTLSVLSTLDVHSTSWNCYALSLTTRLSHLPPARWAACTCT